MFEFTPVTEEELEMAGLIDEGKYDAVIISAQSKLSKAQLPMIELVVKVYGNDHSERNIYCYLTDKMPRLLKHLCDALGLDSKYKSGRISPDLFVGENVSVMVGIQKDKNGVYPPRNNIHDFISRAQSKESSFDNTDVPF
jgi:hypothetical protein